MNHIKRKYNNSLREKNAEQTRAVILGAVLTELADPALPELSMAQIAKSAGVSQATVFRHFPNKDALFEAFAKRAAAKVRLSPNLVDNLAEFPERVATLFDYFQENKQLLAAARRLPDLARYANKVRKQNADRVEQLVSERYPDLPAEKHHMVAAVLHLVFSAQSWLWFVDAFGLAQADAVKVACWAFDTLLDRLDRDRGEIQLNRPGKRRRSI